MSRAAARLNMSQPAASHALARLRELLDDQLLIREGAGLSLTIKAMEIAKPLAEVLSGVRSVLGPSGFEPATTQHRFHLSMSDYGGSIVLPELVRELRKDAPGIDLAISQFSREGMIARVLDGEIDIGFGVFPHWGVAPQLIAGTDLILTIARGGLKNLPPDDNLIVLAAPVALPPIPFVQIWHKRRESDPAHRWLRTKTTSALSEV